MISATTTMTTTTGEQHPMTIISNMVHEGLVAVPQRRSLYGVATNDLSTTKVYAGRKFQMIYSDQLRIAGRGGEFQSMFY